MDNLKNITFQIKDDFPIFQNNPNLIYLDNPATTQCPKCVLDKIIEYYCNYKANIHRGVYKISEKATYEYEKTREIISNFINANSQEVIFTKGTTESINLVAYSYVRNILKEGDIILLSEVEHHSNLLPWQVLTKEKKILLKFIPVDLKTGTLNFNKYREIIEKYQERIKFISISHVSNVLGIINDIKEIIKIAHENNIKVLIDAAQSIPHMEIDVKLLDCDFLGFSGHKICGPTGVGILFAKKELLETMLPYQTGGSMIKKVKFEDFIPNKIPYKFEAGTQNIANIIGFGEAIKYIKKIGIKNIYNHSKALIKYTIEKLKEIEEIKTLGPENNERIGIISFYIPNIHAHDIAQFLDSYEIAVRAGHLCAQPLLKKFNISSCVRIGTYFYNFQPDIDKLIEALKKCIIFFRK